MIEADKRQAVYLLHQEGMSVREIARRLGISRNTVRAIIEQKGAMPVRTRRDQIQIDPDLLKRLYQDCDGRVQRMHEKLMEEENIPVAYPTLTRMLRRLGLGRSRPARCARVPDEPGAEMQHDTTLYSVLLAEIRVRLIASLLYLRYSKRRYLKFYPRFDRFRMKCFLHEALMFWRHAARTCIIDNTNLARLRGTGREAVIVPEMEAFAKAHGFRFLCHEKGHANRKAGEERSFWTVETNFFPGRSFQSLEDLNRQALEWATIRMDNRPVAKTGLIPAQAFGHERDGLVSLPAHLPPPYRIHEKRGTDQYGYAAFGGNYYWIPGTSREDVRVLEYSESLKIYRGRACLVEYPLPAGGVSNQLFSPPGMPPPAHQPTSRKRPTQEEEKRLRAMPETVGRYLDFALRSRNGSRRHRFLRELFALSGRMIPSLFVQTLERALRYQITEVETLRRMARLLMAQGEWDLSGVDVDESFREREAYQQGSLTDAPDFSPYEEVLEDEEEDEDG